LSFRSFIRLGNSKKAPDHTVFSRFRNQLIKHKIYDALFEELNRQLENRGLIIKKGTLVDATVIEAAPKKPNQNPDGSAGKSPIDVEADWTRKGGKYVFGYKAHVGVDQDSELIRSAIITPARVCDSKMLGAVIKGDEAWVYADKIYDTGNNDELLKSRGIENGIMINSGGRREVTEMERSCNRFLAGIRYPVERIFGTLKRSYKYARARYVGLHKNDLHLKILSMAYNLRKMEKLCG
jgi:transposase, IS5 family